MKAMKVFALAMAAVMLLAVLLVISPAVSAKSGATEEKSTIITPKDGGVMYIGQFNPIKIHLSKEASVHDAGFILYDRTGAPLPYGANWFPGDKNTVYLNLEYPITPGTYELTLWSWEVRTPGEPSQMGITYSVTVNLVAA